MQGTLTRISIIRKGLGIPRMHLLIHISNLANAHFWELCHNSQIQVLGENMEHIPQRQKDVELMKLFIQMGYWNMELQMLNRCRLYMRVIYLLDICNAGGTKLEQYLWNQPTIAKSPYHWPVIPKPTATEWRLWTPTGIATSYLLR